MIEEYDQVSARFEPDYNEPHGDNEPFEGRYDSGRPISIFNHPPFAQMSLREFGELERSWP